MAAYYFRVDGGSIYSIATGHIKRCLKLADYISSREKANIYFIMKNYREGVSLIDKRYEVILLNIDQGIEAEIELLKAIMQGNSLFICDIRNIGAYYIEAVKKMCSKFILFDDLGIKSLKPDVLINPTPFCYDDYSVAEYPNTDLLLGEKYFFINKTLLNNESRAKDFNKQRYNIIASFGGADPLNITEFFINYIAPRLYKHNISIVLGPAYKWKDQIMSKYNLGSNTKIYTGLTSLDDMFLRHDVAFVCGGDTCIEACSCGLATFIIPSIYYEKSIAKLLHDKGLAYFIADFEEMKNRSYSESYLDILGNNNLLSRISREGMNLTDGNGLERIYDILYKDKYECERHRVYKN